MLAWTVVDAGVVTSHQNLAQGTDGTLVRRLGTFHTR